MGDEKAFNTAYKVMKFLYEIIDNQISKIPSLAGVTRERARAMATEFVSKNKDEFKRTTPELNGTVTRVSADLTTDQHSGVSYYTVRISIRTRRRRASAG